MVTMDSVWLQRIGLILTGLAAVSFLPTIVGEARMYLLSDKVRRFQATARDRVTQSLAYSHSSIILLSSGVATFIVAIAVLRFVIDSPTQYGYAAGFSLLAATIFIFLGGALAHIEGCRNTSDTKRAAFLRRRYASLHLLMVGVLIPLVFLVSYLTRPDGEGAEPLRLAAVLWSGAMGVAGAVMNIVLSETLLRKERSRSLLKITDSAYQWLITPFLLVPSQATWRGISFIVRGSTEVMLGSLLWASRSRNIQFFAFLVFLTGVALQFWSTW